MTEQWADVLTAAGQDAGRLSEFLAEHGSGAKIKDRFGRGLLHYAAEARHAAGVAVLLRAGLSPNVHDTHSQDTPLQAAVASDCLACTQLLLDAGADPNLANERGETPLFAARSVELLTCLLAAGARQDLHNASGQSLLRYSALRIVSAEVLQYWIDHGHSVEESDDQQRTPIHGLFELGFSDVRIQHAARADCLERLLAAGADVNAADGGGRTPLHHAAWHSCDTTQFLQRLLTAGANPNGQDRGGRTPLMTAASKDLLPAIELLLQHDADPDLFDAYHNYAVDLCSSRSATRQRLQQVTHKLPKPAVKMADIIRRLLTIPRYTQGHAQPPAAGCTPEELAALEEAVGVALPASYRLFLSRLGHGVGDFLLCDHLAFQYPFVLKTAVSRAAACREYAALPQDAVVIMTRLGDWTAWYRSGDRSQDPAVYAVESSAESSAASDVASAQAKPKRIARSLSDFFDDLVRDHEHWFGTN